MNAWSTGFDWSASNLGQKNLIKLSDRMMKLRKQISQSSAVDAHRLGTPSTGTTLGWRGLPIAWSSLDKGESSAYNVTSPFNKKKVVL